MRRRIMLIPPGIALCTTLALAGTVGPSAVSLSGPNAHRPSGDTATPPRTDGQLVHRVQPDGASLHLAYKTLDSSAMPVAAAERRAADSLMPALSNVFTLPPGGDATIYRLHWAHTPGQPHPTMASPAVRDCDSGRLAAVRFAPGHNAAAMAAPGDASSRCAALDGREKEG
jgi:hypothetical protein